MEAQELNEELRGEKEQAEHLQGMAKRARRGRLRSALKRRRRNLQPKGHRTKSWAFGGPEDWDDLGYDNLERIMPRDEGDRRRALERAAFALDLPDESEPQRNGASEGRQGVVVSVARGLCQVEIDGRTLQCGLRGSLASEESGFTNAVAVGDEVTVHEDGTGSGVVESVLPRRSALVRPDVFYSHLRQVVVANAHQLLIVASWREPTIWMELIDRYVIAADLSGLDAVLCVNKVDLVEDKAELESTLEPYRALGLGILTTSAVTGEGVEPLRDVLRERITVLAGLSGTGKSSLLSAVQPGLQLRTAEVSAHSGEGRHATTQATMLRLDVGGAVVDTPGIREFGLSGLRRQELAALFPEIAQHASVCRFADCAHLSEAGCAVRAARDAGAVPESRYHSYTLIYPTLPA